MMAVITQREQRQWNNDINDDECDYNFRDNTSSNSNNTENNISNASLYIKLMAS